MPRSATRSSLKKGRDGFFFFSMDFLEKIIRLYLTKKESIKLVGVSLIRAHDASCAFSPRKNSLLLHRHSQRHQLN